MRPRFAPSAFWLALPWCVLPVLGHELSAVEVVGHYDNALGNSEAASQGVLGAEALNSKALV